MEEFKARVLKGVNKLEQQIQNQSLFFYFIQQLPSSTSILITLNCLAWSFVEI